MPICQASTLNPILPSPALSGDFCTSNKECPAGTYCSGKLNALAMAKCCPEGTKYNFYTEVCDIVCIDNDGDGFGEGCIVGNDCDETNIFVNDGAIEYCDDIDNDCDGKIDEGCIGLISPGAYNQSQESPSISCFMLEICNGRDDNCNGIVDDECIDLDYISTNTSLSTENIHVEGKLKWGESDCDWDPDCDPGLECTSRTWYPSDEIDGCCYPGEFWDGKKCYTLGINESDCDEDANCNQGLHCSTTESGAWTRDFKDDVCCPDGQEYDQKAKGCKACGVWAMPDDSDYCEKKERIGCGCYENEGDCDSNNECMLGTYCYDAWWTDRCCSHGTALNNDICEPTNLNISCEECTDCNPNKCYSIGMQCRWQNNQCVTITQFNRNEASCQDNDSYCCDMDNGCNPDVDLECMNDAYVGFNNNIDFSVCCYPWERQGESGRCELDTPMGDRDNNFYWDRVEVFVGANPMIERDTPFKRLLFNDAGSYFNPPFVDDSWGEFFINVLKAVISSVQMISSIGTGRNANAYNYGMVTGFISGAVFGLVDDISFAAMLIKFVIYIPIKVAAFFSDKSDGTEVLAAAGYSIKSLWTGVKEAFSNIGDLFKEIGNEGIDTLEQRAITLSPFEDEKDQIVMTKSFIKHYIVAFIIEQIFLLKGLSSIKTMNIGKFFSYIDKIQGVPVEIAKIAALKLGRWGMWVLRVLKLTDLGEWGYERIVNVIKLMSSARNEKYLEKLFIKLGNEGAYEAAEQIARLIDDIGSDKVAKLLKSNVGLKALEMGWSDSAQKILAELIDSNGRSFYNKAFKHFTNEQIELVGKRLDSLPESLGKEILETPGGAKALLEFTDEAALKAYSQLSKELSSELAEQLLKRADAEEIIAGLAKKLDVEQRLNGLIKKIAIPDNIDDAAKVLKFFNDPGTIKQFDILEKLGYRGNVGISFIDLGDKTVGSAIGTDAIVFNIRKLDGAAMQNAAVIHEFGHIQLNQHFGLTTPALTPAKEMLNDIKIARDLIDIGESQYSANYLLAIRDNIGVRDVDYFVKEALNAQPYDFMDSAEVILNYRKSKWADVMRTYHEALYHGLDDVALEVERSVGRELGQEAVDSMKRSKGVFMEVFQKDPNLIDADDLAKTAEALDSTYDDLIRLSDGITGLVDDIAARFGDETAQIFSEGVYKFGKEYTDSIAKFIDTVDDTTLRKIIESRWLVLVDSTDEAVIKETGEYLARKADMFKSVDDLFDTSFKKIEFLKDSPEVEFPSMWVNRNTPDTLYIDIRLQEIDEVSEMLYLHEKSHLFLGDGDYLLTGSTDKVSFDVIKFIDDESKFAKELLADRVGSLKDSQSIFKSQWHERVNDNILPRIEELVKEGKYIEPQRMAYMQTVSDKFSLGFDFEKFVKEGLDKSLYGDAINKYSQLWDSVVIK